MTAPSVHDSPDWLALVAGIIEHPDADLPRLVAADWLDEHGEEERAEFIRVSVEFDRLYPEECVVEDPGHCALLNRLNLLFDRWADEWWPLEGGLPCRREFVFRDPGNQRPHLLIRRGFPAAWRGSLGQWFRPRPCPVCGHRLRHDRGSDPATENTCATCQGNGALPACGPAVVARHPVTRVEVSDRAPAVTLNGRLTFHQTAAWFRPGPWADGVLHQLPPGIAVGMFDTEQDARKALSRDLLRRAKASLERAGLAATI